MSEIIKAVNEPIKSYSSGSPERESLQAKYDEMASQNFDIPLIIIKSEEKTTKCIGSIIPFLPCKKDSSLQSNNHKNS